METLEFRFDPLPPEDAPSPAERLAALLTVRPDATLVVCDVSALDRPGHAELDQLARLRLTAVRAGRELRLCGTRPRLRLLLALTGLGEVLGIVDEAPSDPGERGGVRGQPHGEPP